MQWKNASPRYIAGNLLYSLLREYSPSGREGNAVEALVEWGRNAGLNTWIDDVGSIFLAPPDTSEVSILLAGHIDTVPGWIEPGWRNGRLWGRGAVDAKGPLASMATGLLLLAREYSSCPIVVAGLVGEEAESRGAWRLVRDNVVPTFVMIGEPSGGDKVVIGYRGGFHVEVECTTKGGHSSSPQLGDSALDKAINLVDAVRGLYSHSDPGAPSIAVTGFKAWEAWNVLPRKAVIRLDVRVPPGYEVEDVIVELRGVVEDKGCNITVHEGIKPIRVSINSPVPRALTRSLLSLGVKPKPVVKRGTSDMNILGLKASSIAAYGPGDSSMAHSTMETVSEAELCLAAEVYKRSILELCNRASLDSGSIPISSFR